MLHSQQLRALLKNQERGGRQATPPAGSSGHRAPQQLGFHQIQKTASYIRLSNRSWGICNMLHCES